MSIGQIVKTRRMELGLTIPRLSELSSLSKGFISQVENDKASLSLDSLTKIAHALQISVHQLFQDTGFEAEIIRKENRPKMTMGDGIEFEILSTPFGRQIQVLQLVCPIGYVTESHSHEGEEWIQVLQGQIIIEQSGRKATLFEGDSIHLDGAKPHAYRNSFQQPATLLISVTPPTMLPTTKL